MALPNLSRNVGFTAAVQTADAYPGRLDDINRLTDCLVLHPVGACGEVCNQRTGLTSEVSHQTQDGRHQLISAIKNLVSDRV